ncbi:aminotransferase class I/II-fold pyridoxal phosphate-dependent enzyme [Desulfotomaculum sp. 1211_IL3151]|uniref:aminotransferase class I/II-fold pyridoxal phosphate-dependent enzyme n=1 Tax=Desulfotomaculum sp. 1211_IL3151 TaxID=3084055 RepID=UPI002FD94163
MNQKDAPLWQAIKKQVNSRSVQLHIPGHNGGQAIASEFKTIAGRGIFQMDLTEIPGLDDLHNPGDVIAKAQALAADLYGADKSYFLINGTSCGIIALIMSLCKQGGKIIIPRNAHRSVLSGLVLAGAEPIYYQPAVLPGFGCLVGPEPVQIRDLLQKHRDVKAVIGVSPTYYGIVGDIAGVAKICKMAGVPLLVDEAHGSHLRFHPEFPPDALRSGADAVVQSTHKTGGSLTQSSLLHLKGEQIEAGLVAEALRMLQSTSPSYILMASLDLARRQMAQQGKDLLSHTLELSHWCREKLLGIPGVRLLSVEELGLPGAMYLDPTRLTISLLELGLTGYQTAELLAERYGVIVEMADYASIVAILSVGSRLEDCHRLVEGIGKIAVLPSGKPRAIPQTVVMPAPEVVLSPREAWQRLGQRTSLEQCLGQISGETVAVYPPGIPVVGPGEKITASVLAYLLEIRAQGYKIQGPEDPTLMTLKILI